MRNNMTKDIIKPIRFSKDDIKAINKGVKLVNRLPGEKVTFGGFVRMAALHDAGIMVLAEGVDN